MIDIPKDVEIEVIPSIKPAYIDRKYWGASSPIHKATAGELEFYHGDSASVEPLQSCGAV